MMKHWISRLLCLVCLLSLCVPCMAAEKTPEELFLRLHVRANSDSAEDQALKLLVRDAVLEETGTLLRNAENKEDAMRLVSANFERLHEVAAAVVAENGFDGEVRVSIEKTRFDRREYDGFFLPEGVYDALLVEIGTGEGANWWCVVYPAVCLSGAVSGEVQVDLSAVPALYRKDQAEPKVRFDFWIVHAIRELFNRFFEK